jgi:hypothetical protein
MVCGVRGITLAIWDALAPPLTATMPRLAEDPNLLHAALYQFSQPFAGLFWRHRYSEMDEPCPKYAPKQFCLKMVSGRAGLPGHVRMTGWRRATVAAKEEFR